MVFRQIKKIAVFSYASNRYFTSSVVENKKSQKQNIAVIIFENILLFMVVNRYGNVTVNTLS